MNSVLRQAGIENVRQMAAQHSVNSVLGTLAEKELTDRLDGVVLQRLLNRVDEEII